MWRLLQKAMEQTAEMSLGLQPLVAQLSTALNRAQLESHGNQTQGMCVWSLGLLCA